MEVMNTDQFSQTEVLVGQKAATRAMRVSDDPMLMSMLSTGFYANPHRTMIQEVMFNAWDAHSMGNCQDKPIDIYINSTTGLIVRDYGPGIPDDDMEAVYGVYGHSTKRLDKRQTGGFGLGSKSPFAYTESFTVTSHCEGSRSMYVISRVSDNAQGKPGITPIVTTETEEHGLTVAIPLKRFDQQKTYNYIKDILYLSGIKANIHYEERMLTAERVDSYNILPGEYVMDHNNQSPHLNGTICAVYGGVRYNIVSKDEYVQEFKFINIISKIHPVFIGFQPDTLTPLPTREGLNMSEKTKENIRVGLELCMERFQTTFEPMIHAYFRRRFDDYAENLIEGSAALNHALRVVQYGDNAFLDKFRRDITPLVPPHTDASVWNIAAKILTGNMATMIDVVGKKRWNTILLHHFIRCYPNDKDLAYMVRNVRAGLGIDENQHGYHDMENRIAAMRMPRQLKKLHIFEKQFNAAFEGVKTVSRLKMRLFDRASRNKYFEVSRNRAEKRIRRRIGNIRTRQKLDPNLKIPDLTIQDTFEFSDRIFDPTDSREITTLMMSDCVILASTITGLKNSFFDYGVHFSVDDRSMSGYMSGQDGPMPVYVIHHRKGGYATALKMLQNLGYTVLQADEPPAPSVTKVSKAKGVKKQFRRIDLTQENWRHGWDIDITNENYEPDLHGVPLTKPTYFLYVTAGDIKESYYRSTKPTLDLLRPFLKRNPEIAMVNNATQAEALIKMKIPAFDVLVFEWFNALSKNVYRIRNMVRAMKIIEITGMSTILLKNSILSSALGMSPVGKADKNFWEDIEILLGLKYEDYEPLRSLKKTSSLMIQEVWRVDPQAELVEQRSRVFGVFHEGQILAIHSRITKNDQFFKSLSRFLRTTTT